MNIYLASPRGFCSGVRRALNLVQDQIDRNPRGTKICILHEVVHNEYTVRKFENQGVLTVDHPEDVPDHSILIFSAHGVSEEIEKQARSRDLEIIDATCPLVKNIHRKASELSRAGYHILLFGKARHREVEGILGRIPGAKTLLTSAEDAAFFQPNPAVHYACLCQTTFNTADLQKMSSILQKKIPALLICGNVCSATQERQNSVRALARKCDAVLIVGSGTSSNTKRLQEAAASEGARAYLVSGKSALQPEMFQAVQNLGIASGASAPEELVREILQQLLAEGGILVGEIHGAENAQK